MIMISTLLVRDCLALICITRFLSNLAPSFLIFNVPSQVCREWEGTALKVQKDVRLALIRIGVVLGKDGGALGMISCCELFV